MAKMKVKFLLYNFVKCVCVCIVDILIINFQLGSETYKSWQIFSRPILLTYGTSALLTFRPTHFLSYKLLVRSDLFFWEIEDLKDIMKRSMAL